MADTRLQYPPGYQELCAKLRVERDPAEFQMLMDQINGLLREFEAANAHGSSRLERKDLSLELLVSPAN
jgi:hypothetical protein